MMYLKQISPYRFIWNWPLVWEKFELWRLVTPFIFFGGFSFSWLIDMYLLVSYSRNYEVSPYNTGAGGTTADYAWMLILGMTIMLIISTFMGFLVPSKALIFMVLYVWTRRNPQNPVSIYGVQLKAVHLPWALLGLNLVIGNPLAMPILGIIVGHMYYFAIEVLPLQYGTQFIQTPNFIMNMLDDPPPPGGTAYPAAPPQRRDQGGGAAPAGGAYQRGRGHNWGTGRPLGVQ